MMKLMSTETQRTNLNTALFLVVVAMGAVIAMRQLARPIILFF